MNLGVISLIFAITSIFIPVAGAHITILVAFIAMFAIHDGLLFGIFSIFTNLINIIFLSPSVWATAYVLSEETEADGALSSEFNQLLAPLSDTIFPLLHASMPTQGNVYLFALALIFIGPQVLALLVLLSLHLLIRRKKSKSVEITYIFR